MGKKCLKCGILFEVSKENSTYAENILCKPCLKKWGVFFDKHHFELQAKFPKIFNPTWSVFLGKLKVKEKIEFT